MTIELYDANLLPAKPPATHAMTRTLPAAWRLFDALLKRLEHGNLRVHLPDGGAMQYGSGGAPVSLFLHDWRALNAVLRCGDIGFAQAYIDGAWSSDNLPALLTLLARNRGAIERLVYGSWWGQLAYRARHLLNRNSRAGSRRNIHAHYDIGNAFYRLWLDPTMTYSSALFSGRDGETLAEAQQEKYRRIVRELGLNDASHVLEIGCGWGGFAEVAAREAGAAVTGLTLSSEQLAYAQARIARAGLRSKADLRLQDYRDTTGQYNAIASIEMFEAVGEQYWPQYFNCLARSLKAGGRACIQTITIADALFARYRQGTDFIQQYIFPGGMLPSPDAFRASAARHGLQVVNELAFGRDYARTLREWRTAFHRALPEVRAQGFDERFIRTWDFYLAYCEAGFEAGSIDVMQFTLRKA